MPQGSNVFLFSRTCRPSSNSDDRRKIVLSGQPRLALSGQNPGDGFVTQGFTLGCDLAGLSGRGPSGHLEAGCSSVALILRKNFLAAAPKAGLLNRLGLQPVARLDVPLDLASCWRRLRCSDPKYRLTSGTAIEPSGISEVPPAQLSFLAEPPTGHRRGSYSGPNAGPDTRHSSRSARKSALAAGKTRLSHVRPDRPVPALDFWINRFILRRRYRLSARSSLCASGGSALLPGSQGVATFTTSFSLGHAVSTRACTALSRGNRVSRRPPLVSHPETTFCLRRIANSVPN